MYFTNTARIQIQSACKSPLIKAWKTTSEIVEKKDADSRILNNIISSLTPKKLYLHIEDREVYLTKREYECARLVAQGKTNRMISDHLHISPPTVETHIESLKIKTSCQDRPELINILIQHRLVNFL
ncbi:response regulator transcription factor [Legionella sp. CNM-4043-24]|uniref:response regulator transcription factor n=1 Tax=Legionella sp. CNM-4043-24 TaxID=3421646 RepID=UPI00403ABA01